MTTFFLTEYQGTEPDGGRDGLGLLPLWSQVARRCVWNLTSISSDVAGWRSVMVCAWMAELATADAPGLDQRDAMLAAERLVGLARCFAPDPTARDPRGLRGGTRLTRQAGAVCVSGSDRITILKGQNSTGVVGQVGRPAIRSGLLTEELRLTAAARTRMDAALEPLKSEAARLRGWLLDGAPLNLDNPSVLLTTVARASSGTPASPDEARWLLERVGAAAHGADPDGDWVPARQAALVGALQQLSALEHGTHTLPDLLTGHLGHGPAESAVRTWLHDIRALEELLGRMDELFAWMRCVTAQARSWHWMEGQLQEQWQQAPWWTAPASERIEHALNLLQGLVASDDLEPFRAFSNALASGDPQGCLKALLQRNRTVVTQRDRRPWLVSHGGTLRAEITSQRATLRSAPAWEHSYYLAELQRVVRECRVALPDGVVG